jgi:hypothetical protein
VNSQPAPVTLALDLDEGRLENGEPFSRRCFAPEPIDKATRVWTPDERERHRAVVEIECWLLEERHSTASTSRVLG